MTCGRLSLLALTLLGGCAVGPDYQPPRIAMPERFQPVAETVVAVDPAHWWRVLGDTQLDALVDRAVAANPDIAIALSRLQQARQQEAALYGLVLPFGEADGALGKGTGSDVTRGRVPSILTSADNTATAANKQIRQIGGFDATWELDLFGRARRAIEAGSADSEAAGEARNGVLTAVIGDLVRLYIDLRGTQMRLVVLDDGIRLATDQLSFVRQRYQRGLTNELDLRLAERQLAALQAELGPLAAQQDAARYAIAALVGDFPDQSAIDLRKARPIPPLPEAVDPGLPLDLLKRRPDIRQNERQLAAATARIGVAIGALFPRLGISGVAGVQFASLGSDHGQHIWSLGPAATWPLLDFGALDAQIEIADLKSQEQLLAYKRSLISAVRDVDSAMAGFAGQQDAVRRLDQAVTAGVRAVDLARERYRRGLTDYLNVVDAERQQYALQGQLIQAQQAAGDAFVTLYRSLGGGWEGFAAPEIQRLPHPAVMAMFERLTPKED